MRLVAGHQLRNDNRHSDSAFFFVCVFRCNAARLHPTSSTSMFPRTSIYVFTTISARVGWAEA